MSLAPSGPQTVDGQRDRREIIICRAIEGAAMAEAAISRSGMIPVVGLAVAAFAVVTAELIIAGLLPNVAADLGVDIPTAGLLLTGYALGVAIVGPILALVPATLPRRALLLGLVVVFIVGNGICAISASYGMLLAARLVIACCHGLYI